jgi:hypothetical protein
MSKEYQHYKYDAQILQIATFPSRIRTIKDSAQAQKYFFETIKMLVELNDGKMEKPNTAYIADVVFRFLESKTGIQFLKQHPRFASAVYKKGRQLLADGMPDFKLFYDPVVWHHVIIEAQKYMEPLSTNDKYLDH